MRCGFCFVDLVCAYVRADAGWIRCCSFLGVEFVGLVLWRDVLFCVLDLRGGCVLFLW